MQTTFVKTDAVKQLSELAFADKKLRYASMPEFTLVKSKYIIWVRI